MSQPRISDVASFGSPAFRLMQAVDAHDGDVPAAKRATAVAYTSGDGLVSVEAFDFYGDSTTGSTSNNYFGLQPDAIAKLRARLNGLQNPIVVTLSAGQRMLSKHFGMARFDVEFSHEFVSINSLGVLDGQWSSNPYVGVLDLSLLAVGGQPAAKADFYVARSRIDIADRDGTLLGVFLTKEYTYQNRTRTIIWIYGRDSSTLCARADIDTHQGLIVVSSLPPGTAVMSDGPQADQHYVTETVALSAKDRIAIISLKKASGDWRFELRISDPAFDRRLLLLLVGFAKNSAVFD